jgi:glycosyltransferase involved in cell wall biosynthesis
MKKIPYISIIIPTFRRQSSLTMVLDALSTQREINKAEIIIVNNAPEDDLSLLIANQKVNALIKLFVEHARGAGAARNKGIIAAKGKIIWFIDDDVVPAPNCLRHHLEFHDNHEDTRQAAVGMLRHRCKEDYTPIMAYLEKSENSPYNLGRVLSSQHQFARFVTANLSIKRSFLLNYGLFDPSFLRGQDTELGYRLINVGLKLSYISQAVATHWKRVTTHQFLTERRQYGGWYAKMRELHPDFPLYAERNFDEDTVSLCREFVNAAEDKWSNDSNVFGLRGLQEMLFAGYRMLAAYEVCKGIVEFYENNRMDNGGL